MSAILSVGRSDIGRFYMTPFGSHSHARRLSPTGAIECDISITYVPNTSSVTGAPNYGTIQIFGNVAH